MMKEDIEKRLRAWFSQMTEKYAWLRIKFEFNESRGVYMVSFSPLNHIESSDDFNIDVMTFADEMNALYGNDAPLFTDEESLFVLSSDAEVISAPRSFISVGCSSPSSTSISVQPYRASGVWTSSLAHTTASSKKNFRQNQVEPSYALAA